MGHTIIRPYSTGDTHPDEPNVTCDNDLCQAIRADNHVYLIGKWMRGILYCSTGVTVASLARPEWVVEIDACAVIPRDEASAGT